jgi:NAD-dependent SIR2 family protein deacetylase
MSKKKSKNRVVFIGAGFSISAGIPPQGRLLTDIFDIKEEEPDYRHLTIRDDRTKLEGFFKALYGRSWAPENISLEDIYTMVDTAILRQRNIGIFNPSALFKIRESLDRLILYIVNKDISPEDIKQYGEKVSELIGTWNTDFISLNWDYLLERVLIDLGYRIDYGVPLERTYKHNLGSSRLLVLKPHGSLNWRLCPICESIYVFMEDENIFQCTNCREIYESKREIMEVLQTLDLNFNQGLLPLLVSPTFLKAHSVPQLNTIMHNMYSVLTKADELVFIGYSLPISDHDIRDLLIKSYSIIKQKIRVKVILKSSSKAEKAELVRHYKSIFDDSILNFRWNGF